MNDTVETLRKKIEKTVADLSKEQRQVIRTGDAMTALVANEAFKFYCTVLDKAIDLQRHEADSVPAPGEDGIRYALRMERLKGTIIGLRLALEQPSIMIRVGKETQDRLLGAGKGDT